jgi:uncharacterized protein with von Willebrand factor type A (vWA) domain
LPLVPDNELSPAAIRQGVGAKGLGGTLEDFDGGRFLAVSVEFGRALRAAGLPIDLGAAIDFARSLTLVHIGDRDEVMAAGETVFIRRHDDLDIYKEVFDRFWRARRPAMPLTEVTSLIPSSPEQRSSDEAGENQGQERPAARPRPSPMAPTPSGDEADDKPIDGVIVAPDAYSFGEILRHKEFERMTRAELREAERFIDLLKPRLEQRRTRRQELDEHGRILAPRAMFRRNLAAGGDLVEWIWRRPIRRPRPLIVICDISGSMERQSRLLLRFVQALSGSAVHAEAFVFGTRLTRVTRLLRDRDRDRALARVSEAVNDWAGGTRIGESLRQFNQKWARRVMKSGSVVVIVSDGWDRGDPRVVAAEMARLQRSCHRLIWLNPLAGAAGYQPLAAGMQAAYPFIDDFLPAGTVANLQRLGEILAGTTGGRTAGRPYRRAGGRRPLPTERPSDGRSGRASSAPAAPPARRLGAWANAGSSASPAATGSTASAVSAAAPARPTEVPLNAADPSVARPLT